MLGRGRRRTRPTGGKILIVGDKLIPYDRDAVVVRATSTGSLDISFGSGGVTDVPFGGDSEQFNDLVLQADGTIVAAGSSGVGADRDVIVARILADGSPDSTFDSGINATVELGGDEAAWSLAVQTDGKVLLAGQQDAEWAVLRLVETPPDSASPVVLSGSATGDVGVDEVHLEVKDRDTGDWWNGSGWQTDRVKLEAVLDAGGSTSTGWSYSFDPPGDGVTVLPYWMTSQAFDAAGNPSLRDTRYSSIS